MPDEDSTDGKSTRVDVGADEAPRAKRRRTTPEGFRPDVGFAWGCDDITIEFPTPRGVPYPRTADEVLRWIISSPEGLTLYFNTRLTPFDRFLVDGVIFGVLGKDTDCRVVQFEARGDTAIVRLEAVCREDLEAVADALWDRVWEQAKKAQQAALIRLAEGLVVKLQPGLTELRDKLDRIELRLPGEDAVERQNDLGADHVRQKDLKVVRTWQEKLVIGATKKAAQKVGEDVVDAAIDGLKGCPRVARRGTDHGRRQYSNGTQRGSASLQAASKLRRDAGET